MENSKTQFRSAILWTTGLSIFLGWLIVVGPFVAGFVGGRKAKSLPNALLAAVAPAILWIAIWTWLSKAGMRIGKESVTLPLDLFAIPTVLSLFGGAMAGTTDKPVRVIGTLAALCGLAYFGNGVWKIYSVARLATAGAGDAGPDTNPENKTCPERLKKLYDAVMLYSDSWDGQLPPADHWMSALRDKTQQFGEEEYLHCPAVSTGKDSRYGYAMNRDIGGKRVKEIKDAARTPLFFDLEDTSLNANAPASAIPSPGRHAGKSNIVFADGHLGQKQP